MKKPFKAFHPFKLGVIIKAINSIWSPRKLFTNGEQGVWYDPSDLTTLYQDAAGTTPVTAVEQPVGLMLDKRKGLVLGPELVTNGDFSGGVFTPWDGHGATLSIDTNRLKVVGFPGQGASQVIPIKANTFYKLTIDIISSSNDWNVLLGSGWGLAEYYNAGRQSGSKSISIYIYSTATANAMLQFYMYGANQTAIIDNISVRELPGNHAYQTVSTKRPVLSARVNLLTKTEQFGTGSIWRPYNSTIQDNTTDTLDPLGVNKAAKGIYAGVAAGCYYDTTLTGSLSYSVYAKKGTYDVLTILANATPAANATFNLTSGVSSGTNCTTAMVSVGNDWWKCKMTFSMSGSWRLINYFGTTTGHNLYLWGASLVPANQASLPYQRVNTATDYDTQGFPTYLKFDGIDDAMQTNSIDFSATDKMTVFAGVRKLSDATTGLLTEFSASTATNAGSFFVALPIASTASYRFESKGTAISSASSLLAAYPAPSTNVLTGIGNISGDQSILRVNGTQAAIDTADQGTGNYGNYPLYIGARVGTSVFFNGHLYGLIVRGAQSTAAQIESTEQWVNGKTAAF